MLKLFSKIKANLKNNENKNGLINLYLLDSYAKKHDFTLVDTGCGNGSNLIEIITKYPDATFIGIDNYKPDLFIIDLKLNLRKKLKLNNLLKKRKTHIITLIKNRKRSNLFRYFKHIL